MNYMQVEAFGKCLFALSDIVSFKIQLHKTCSIVLVVFVFQAPCCLKRDILNEPLRNGFTSREEGRADQTQVRTGWCVCDFLFCFNKPLLNTEQINRKLRYLTTFLCELLHLWTLVLSALLLYYSPVKYEICYIHTRYAHAVFFPCQTPMLKIFCTKKFNVLKEKRSNAQCFNDINPKHSQVNIWFIKS